MPVCKRRSLRLLAILGVFAALGMALSTAVAHQSFAISTNGEHKLYLPITTGSAQPRGSSESPQYDLINQYRSNAGVPLVSHNPVLESQCYDHSRYMAENGVLSHTQDPHLPYASTGGETCARQANIWMASGPLATPWNPDSAIRSWMASIPHRLWLLYPTSKEFGYAFYSTQGGQRAAAAVDILSAADLAADEGYGEWPVRYPGNDEKNVPATRYPITLNWRYFGPEPVLSRVRLTKRDGTSIGHEATTDLTAGHKGIKIIPTNALPANSRIIVTVSGSYDGQPFSYTWRFQTGPAR
jgi:uncharacterized protein YkwD